MSTALRDAAVQSSVPNETKGVVGRVHTAENILVSMPLGAMVIIPLAEAALRRSLHVFIAASTSIVQHMVLIVGMLGGAIAAREKRFLALSNISKSTFRGNWKDVAHMFTGGVSATVCWFLSFVSFQFVQSEREAGTSLISGIPLWLVERVLPIGFAVIALRILWHSSVK